MHIFTKIIRLSNTPISPRAIKYLRFLQHILDIHQLLNIDGPTFDCDNSLFLHNNLYTKSIFVDINSLQGKTMSITDNSLHVLATQQTSLVFSRS